MSYRIPRDGRSLPVARNFARVFGRQHAAQAQYRHANTIWESVAATLQLRGVALMLPAAGAVVCMGVLNAALTGSAGGAPRIGAIYGLGICVVTLAHAAITHTGLRLRLHPTVPLGACAMARLFRQLLLIAAMRLGLALVGAISLIGLIMLATSPVAAQAQRAHGREARAAMAAQAASAMILGAQHPLTPRIAQLRQRLPGLLFGAQSALPAALQWRLYQVVGPMLITGSAIPDRQRALVEMAVVGGLTLTGVGEAAARLSLAQALMPVTIVKRRARALGASMALHLILGMVWAAGVIIPDHLSALSLSQGFSGPPLPFAAAAGELRSMGITAIVLLFGVIFTCVQCLFDAELSARHGA